jgi:hypothetical protein
MQQLQKYMKKINKKNSFSRIPINKGWGRVGTTLPLSETLQKVNYQIYSQRDCAAIFDVGNIHYNNICGGQIGGWTGQCYDKYQTVIFSFLCFA